MILRLPLGLLLATALAACGGGGATTGPLIVPDGAPIKVAVVDSGFKVDDPEIRDSIDAWHVCTLTGPSVQCGGSDIQDATNNPHGTYVAQVIAGTTVGYTDDATLLLAKATNLYTSEIELATQWAVDQGARVVNYSLYPMHEVDTYLGRAYAHAKTNGAALVMSAGNGSINLSTYSYTYGTSLFSSAYADISLVVGAAYQTGVDAYALWSYSNHPGADPNIQARFLTALAPADVVNGSGATVDFNGTSATAPQVSAALATILAEWPHLTAQQSTQLLLDTANDQFTGYSAFYFGQGLLDLNKALQPVGTTSLVTGSSVSGSGYSVSGSGLILPAAFGDAALGLVLDAAMFDRYGRDFGFNLGGLLQSADPWSTSRHWINLLGSSTHEHEDAQVHLRTAFGPDGTLQASRVGLGFGDGHQLHWQRAQGQAFERDALPVPLLTLAGHGTLGSYGWLDQMGLDWRLDDHHRLHASLTRAHRSPDTAQEDQTAWRHEAGLSVRAGAATMLTAGLAITTESGALQGSSGTGALTLNRSMAQAATLRLRHDLGQGWTAFGSAELGSIQVQGDTLLAGMDSVVTSEWAAGLAWTGDDRLLGLAVSQPVRVERASAHFDLPVGRTLDGTVLRQTRTVHLAPSGRQINLEMAWQQRLGGRGAHRGTLGLHAVYARDAGHVRGASDWALLGSYRRSW